MQKGVQAFASSCAGRLRQDTKAYESPLYHGGLSEIIDYARSKDPEFSFTTDLIVGFPSETYEEFCETKELIKR